MSRCVFAELTACRENIRRYGREAEPCGIASTRAPCGYLRRVWAEDADQRLRDTLQAVWGEIPAAPSVQPVVERGEAGGILVGIAGCPVTCSWWGQVAAVRLPG